VASGSLAAAILGSAMVVAGCAPRSSGDIAQLSFDTPESAVSALVGALQRDDTKQLALLLGPGTDDLLSSGDAVADHNARQSFLERYRAQRALVAGGPNDLVLQVGPENWPLPIPLVRHGGRWQFDGAAGAQELVLRRIGANELRTIDVMRGFVDAQRDYAATSHDGAPAGTYAQKLRSQPGKQDGLYWQVNDDEQPSPAGPLLAAAAVEGYSAQGANDPYHGYLYRMLFAQGPDAQGGAQDYLVNGRLVSGFGLIAWPVEYGTSGIMTFIVNQDGVVWQRDLGADTARFAKAMREVNPDAMWTPLAPEQIFAAQ
jgi:hypothetical protein